MKKAIAYTVVGVNRGDGKSKVVQGELADILKHIYLTCEDHDTVILSELKDINEVSLNKENLNSGKIVCVKMNSIFDEEVSELKKEIGISGLRILN